MPIFEFECAECNHTFEFLARSAAEQKQAQCPKCESKRVTKQFSAFGVSGGAKPSSSSAPAASSGPCMPRGCGCH